MDISRSQTDVLLLVLQIKCAIVSYPKNKFLGLFCLLQFLQLVMKRKKLVCVSAVSFDEVEKKNTDDIKNYSIIPSSS